MEKQVREEEEECVDDSSTRCSKVGQQCVMDYTVQFTTHEIFKSREAMIQWTRDTGRMYGFVVVIKWSAAGSLGKKPRVTFPCERSGEYRSTSKKEETSTRARATGTKKCGCPFYLRGLKLSNEDDWMVRVECGVHNHPHVENLEGHSYAGRLSKDENSLLVDMSKSLVRPKDILTTLKQKDHLNVTTMKQIYNARQRNKVIEKAGKSQMQYLMGKLAEHNYIEWHRSMDDTETVRDLLWAHPTSIDLLRAFPCVLIMDCTYKTNRYRLPLLEIVGVTSTDRTFSVAFAYLESEREDTYTWALHTLRSILDDSSMPEVIVTDRDQALMNAIEKVFPSTHHFLCRWHINKNVLAKCKSKFVTNERWEMFIKAWNELVSSSTEVEYNQNVDNLQREFNGHPEAIQYVTNMWLKYKERFVAAWTDMCMHFGNTTSNRAEQSHARLKRQLGSSQVNFEASCSHIHALLELQHTEIKASFEKSLTVVQHNFRPNEFKELRGCISTKALNMILDESKRADSIGVDVTLCGCVIHRTHGLPCAHRIAEYKRMNRPISFESVYDHWKKLDLVPAPTNKVAEMTCQAKFDLIAKRFEETGDETKMQILKKLVEIANPESTCLAPPAVKLDVRGRKTSRSTRRDPSLFEIVLSQHDSCSPQPLRCSPQPLRSSSPSVTRATIQGKRRPKQPFQKTRSSNRGSYINAFPDGIQPFITCVKDVTGDGNCGFRAIADAMGFGQDGWPRVRHDLLSELHAHGDHYVTLYGNYERIKELEYILAYYEPSPGYDRWMSMPDMGHLIASKYNVVLFHLSIHQCLTFLPLRTVPDPSAARKEIAIGFVNGNHFVQVLLSPGHPVPPIASNWTRHRHYFAQGWATAYAARIQRFRSIVGSDVALAETVDLESESVHQNPDV